MGERFPKLIGSKLIEKGTKCELYEIELPKDPEVKAHYIKVNDTSTKRVYWLRTPPTIMDANESWCWTLGIKVENIRDIKQEA